jgi:hypothetical protein
MKNVSECGFFFYTDMSCHSCQDDGNDKMMMMMKMKNVKVPKYNNNNNRREKERDLLSTAVSDMVYLI